jgi:diaminohydroxyphosphoribosylaminopyrimidine deaminase/5-amino-6-(5-phosphoribosylamino)uracil reductase
MFSEQDHTFMSRALALAYQGLNTTMPNPRVGCVIVKDGVVIGEGFHKKAGEPHAEILALLAARVQVGADGLVGATVYLTLEPCTHFGRTPPCVTALIEARVARVLVAMSDPNPLVSEQGLEALRHAGIEVRCGLLHSEAEELNLGFSSRMTRGRPWVRSKLAATLDGKTALNNGQSQWITSTAARADAHAWRARSCAVLTGAGTVLTDNPRLSVRDVETSRQPLRVIVDSQLKTPLDAAIVGRHANEVMIFTAAAEAKKKQAWLALGAEVIELPNAQNQVNLPAMFEHLGQRGLNEITVEAGAKLNTALWQEDCLDELLLYVAPSVMGPGRPMFEWPELQSLGDLQHWRFVEAELIGTDCRLRLRKP